MNKDVYTSRAEAGVRLAEAVRRQLGDPGDAIVLALPRGGVPVGLEVARVLGVPLDLLIVRKIGLPYQPELAMGAIASGGVRVLNPAVLAESDVDSETFERVARAETAELERRESTYRGDRPRPELRGRTVVLVDDGIATGSTVRAAIRAVRASSPARVVVAVPVASPEVVRELEGEADQVVCPLQPYDLYAIGAWYLDFPQLEDADVRTLLDRAWAEESDRPSG